MVVDTRTPAQIAAGWWNRDKCSVSNAVRVGAMHPGSFFDKTARKIGAEKYPGVAFPGPPSANCKRFEKRDVFGDLIFNPATAIGAFFAPALLSGGSVAEAGGHVAHGLEGIGDTLSKAVSSLGKTISSLHAGAAVVPGIGGGLAGILKGFGGQGKGGGTMDLSSILSTDGSSSVPDWLTQVGGIVGGIDEIFGGGSRGAQGPPPPVYGPPAPSMGMAKWLVPIAIGGVILLFVIGLRRR
jgi:hypothetical protein